MMKKIIIASMKVRLLVATVGGNRILCLLSVSQRPESNPDQLGRRRGLKTIRAFRLERASFLSMGADSIVGQHPGNHHRIRNHRCRLCLRA